MNRLSFAFLSLTVTFVACKSTGVDRAEKAANAMKAQHQALADAPAKINGVVTTLNGLTEPGVDMKKQWGLFNDAVAGMAKHRQQIQSLGQEIEANRAGFMEEWQKRLDAITDDDLRQRGSDRRDAVVQKFKELNADADAGKAAFEPWMETVTSLQAYLENDLNPSGVASVADKIEEVSNGATPINAAIQKVVDGLDAMAASIQAGKPPEPTDGTTAANSETGEAEQTGNPLSGDNS